MNVYEIITEQIMEKLRQGDIPWHRPWAGGEPPKNLASKRPYSGINVWLLASTHYASPYWVSYKQAQDLGGNVRAGEHSTMVVFWKQLEVKDKETGEMETVPMLRYYRVFNVAQCDGLESKIPQHEKRPDFQPISECERIVDGMPNKPAINTGEPRAFYHTRLDYVNMPDKQTFDNEQGFYSVLFHELTHSTGHTSRLGRKTVTEATHFGSPSYSREELVAEMGAAYLCGISSIMNKTIDNSAAYIQGWLKHLASDPKAVVLAAAQAQRAADYILGKAKKED
jgi:antirestriction protein ArdC